MDTRDFAGFAGKISPKTNPASFAEKMFDNSGQSVNSPRHAN
jgi:hypothetical protein